MKISASNYVKLSAIVFISGILVSSCGASAEEKYKQMALADSVSAPLQTAVKNNETVKHDSERVFVRNADLHFKVKDVKAATFDIERIVSEHKGYTTSSVLESDVNYKNSIRISADSVMDLTNYTVHNNMVLRIPNEELDKTLNEIATLIDFLDHRKVKADDVTRDLLSARLSEKRFVNHKQRLEKVIEQKGKKLTQTVDAENELLAKQESADNTNLNTMEIAHDVSFSTVTLSIYQREMSKKETYAYSLPIKPYEPNYAQKLWESVSSGGVIFGEILLFFIKLWPIALLAFGVVVLIKFLLKQKWFA